MNLRSEIRKAIKEALTSVLDPFDDNDMENSIASTQGLKGDIDDMKDDAETSLSDLEDEEATKKKEYNITNDPNPEVERNEKALLQKKIAATRDSIQKTKDRIDNLERMSAQVSSTVGSLEDLDDAQRDLDVQFSIKSNSPEGV